VEVLVDRYARPMNSPTSKDNYMVVRDCQYIPSSWVDFSKIQAFSYVAQNLDFKPIEFIRTVNRNK
jgi:hypothetical protein